MKKLKYLSIFSLPLTVAIAFNLEGWWTFLPVIVFFGLVPLIELFSTPDLTNISLHEKELVAKDPFYDALLFLMVFVQFAFLAWFLCLCASGSVNANWVGRVTAMGCMCGIIGINIGHELGHRNERWHRFMGDLLMFTSLENHFTPYHNSGHHHNVATPEDPATARRNEPVFVFWIRSQLGSYFQAWSIEMRRLRIVGNPPLHWRNKMLQYTFFHAVFLASVFILLGGFALTSFLLAAAFGILLLETVNYIEHYGLLRRKRENGTYERVKRIHSWNSNHVVGRVVLFELTRHSDHHYKPDRPYQLLESHEESPIMPTGYPGMMLLALVPPLFFRVMNKRIDEISA
jgi:alkane 1-monooxygenase